MLGDNCPECDSQLLRISSYYNRVRKSVGDFCPDCLKMIRYTSSFYKIHENIIKENKDKRKSKPKFLKQQRKACPYCLKKEIENRDKWTIKKLTKKKDKTQEWKCKCQLCENVWTSNSSDEYYYYPEGYKEYQRTKQKLSY